jgi:hypothetical protein
MIRWFLRRQIAAFERAWNYDAAYLFDRIDTDPHCAMLTFAKVRYLTKYRNDIPVAPYCAAGLIAAMAEDCGPCTQLGIDMAQCEGVDPAVLRAVVTRDYIAMPYKVALAARFTEATLDHAPWADDLREEVMCQFGQRGLTSLAFATAAARCFPVLKYAFGHGEACTRVTVGGDFQPVLRQMPKAA